MSAVALQSFGFGEQLVRVVDRDGAVWFVANDVCAALEISNSSDAVGRLDEDERGWVGITDAIGRERETTIISESGLYALIFRSRKPVAVQFRKWVTGEVLPTLRRTGRYIIAANDPPEPVSPEQMDRSEAWRSGLLLVREARIVGGRIAARRAWAVAGLPDVFDDEKKLPTFVLNESHRTMNEWMNARCEWRVGHRERAMTLYNDYIDWCLANDLTAQPLTALGRFLTACGVGVIRSNATYRVGLRLKS
jgi:prophage antirepressor-like protein